MIYFCVKTDEYLRDILDRVSLGSEYYCQIDVPLGKAESVIQKFTARYALDQTARQRNYRLQKKPVVDLIVLLNQSLYSAEKIRLCLMCTMPKEMRGIAFICSAVLQREYDLDKSEIEQFSSVLERKSRLIYNSVPNKISEKHLDSVPVYELVQIPYTAEQRKQKKIPQTQAQAQGWTWRLHKKFIALKKEQITNAFKKHQKNSKQPLVQDEAVQKELQKLWRLSRFRGVRQDIFNLNRTILTLYLSYFNRKSAIKLEVPSYIIKNKRLANSFKEMVCFHAKR
ncbi:hypothetical protein ACKVE0_08780 [Acinetobacter albensis]|uniref:Uncharacterized protein n=1 Tax=Acinetobacter albensis TaxID=1673609 RepID=A0ABW9JT02_9GAMM